MGSEYADKYCILGAGSSGLAAAKNFLAGGIPFDCLERQDDVGGNWYFGTPSSSVYESTYLVSSKRLTEYTDYPMPKDWPEYPSHAHTWQYLREYASHFGLYDHIQFNTPVAKLQPGVGGWVVRLASGEERLYRGVVIANGHHWDPRWPTYPGEFTGEAIHSSQYKSADVLRGKRVLVVGGGNSGCDLAVEAAVHAKRALHSTRRAYHVLPKFFRGKPIDQCGELLLWLRAPLWARRLAGWVVMRTVLGPPARTGVPKPDHRLFESHPIINSQVHHHVGHGRLRLRPDVKHFQGNSVCFVDGQVEEIDLVLYATGYRVSFPFIDAAHLNWGEEAPHLFLNVFHPERDDLFCVGLIQPDSGQFGLVDYQAQLITRYVQALSGNPRRAEWFRRLKRGPAPDVSGGVRYLRSPRHALEVEHFSYQRRLKKLAAKLG